VRAAVVACGLLAVAGCGDDGGTAPTGDTFIAFATAFQPYPTWTHFHSDGPADDGTYPPDVLGMREQYINKVPPAGSTEFPVGTAIVEVRASGIIFAAAKRGGGFNATGAKDWEWFELLQDDQQRVSLKWRGVGPPAGEMYGGDPNGGCNACHATCGAANDYVCSPKLQLANF
jgi:hypothetical protein